MGNETLRFDPSFRDSIRKALPDETSLYGNAPEIRHTYVPQTHLKALRLEAMLVVGIRGAGKSFWWAALQKKRHRDLLSSSLGLGQAMQVSSGFGEPSSPHYPGKDVLEALLKQFPERCIWKTIVYRHVTNPSSRLSSWNDWVGWVRDHPEEVERSLLEADGALDEAGTSHLILFDALDRTADDWERMNKLTKGLLQTLLEFRSFRRIRLKAFVRPDQIEDPSVAAFPDASKILSQKTDLFWPPNELYGLLWKYLANELDGGDLFRRVSSGLAETDWEQRDGVWEVPLSLKNLEERQRKVFHAITGPWMGRDKRRGFPYAWLVNHLGDSRKEVSPRSFLAAVRQAAQNVPRQDCPYALHYEDIKRGVQEASKIRVGEFQEDYPWVKMLMDPLEGQITVPCDFSDIERIWTNRGVIGQLRRVIQDGAAPVRLPPSHIDEGAKGVLENLKELGLVEEMSDGRINLPDVYRVGYGIGRRGGIRPVQGRRS